VALTVACNLSGPQADREALLLAGIDETVIFLVVAFFNNLCVLEHGLHCSSSMVSKTTLQFGDRNVTDVLK
jgi:hypothetical protein